MGSARAQTASSMNPSIVGASSTNVARPTRPVFCPETIEAEKSIATDTTHVKRIVWGMLIESSFDETGALDVGVFDLGYDTKELFGVRADNIFLIKMNYWLNF
jgi:hypothetical protein